jgi:hypothetical protein
LGLTDATVEELHEAMDWLPARQDHVEQALANRHLRNGTLILHDVTSTHFGGKTCPLGQFGQAVVPSTRIGRMDIGRLID